MLDAEEYLYLAINASKAGEHHASMQYLHQALEVQPENADVLFMLAAEHAELGLISRAIDGLKKALSVNPNLNVASLQLSILYILTEDNASAKSQLITLYEGNTQEDIRLFAHGLMLIIEQDPDNAREKINQGIEINQSNPALNDTMKKIAAELSEPTMTPEKESENKGSTSGVFLGAYQNNLLSTD